MKYAAIISYISSPFCFVAWAGWTLLEEKETAENREMAREKAKAKDTKEVTKAWVWEEMPLLLLVLKTL